jgi:hypothetical protein
MLGLLYRAADALRRRGPGGEDHGRIGEDLAHRYLRSRGCTVVARNYRARSGAGEIDLVAWHGNTLAFVEVKTRATTEFGDPDAAVDAEKHSKPLPNGRGSDRSRAVASGFQAERRRGPPILPCYAEPHTRAARK